jgi:hypothetical protein
MSACLKTLRNDLDRTAAKKLLRDIEPAQCLDAGPAEASKIN